MIAFIAPEAEATANKIHVSYSGCLREAQKRCASIEAKHLEMFRDCLYFALAIDTAQFGRTHFMSCVCRFGFEDHISQQVLFFDKVSETTGRKMARFVVDKLEKNCDLTKMVSITTDGASNMIGQNAGMANEIVKLVNERTNGNKRIGVDVHCLWCMAHRLNLVAQDFKEVENINFVIKFAKWITASDRLVSYSAFLKTNPPPEKKKIPPPSETRWLYYRDTLMAILDQTETIDAFMDIPNNREKWEQHITSSKHPLGPLKDVQFSFKHPLVNAHFRFALFVLDVLGEINTIFQTKYGFFQNL